MGCQDAARVCPTDHVIPSHEDKNTLCIPDDSEEIEQFMVAFT